MSIETALARFPELTTDRLLLRQMQPEDAPALFTIKSNFEVTQRYGQEPHATVADSLAWIERLNATYMQRDGLAWGMFLKDTPGLIGAVTLWGFGADKHCAEIGYEMHPDYEGRGIMREAVAAILDFSFAELELNRVEATPFTENPRSGHLLQKLGFVHEGTLRQRHYFHGRYLDLMYFGLLRAEWENSKNSGK